MCLGLTRSLFHPLFFVMLAVLMSLFLWRQNMPMRSFALAAVLAMLPLRGLVSEESDYLRFFRNIFLGGHEPVDQDQRVCA